MLENVYQAAPSRYDNQMKYRRAGRSGKHQFHR